MREAGEPKQNATTIRALGPADAEAILRLCARSDYIHARFQADELPRLLATHPACGVFSMPPGPLARITPASLQAFLVVNWLAPPNAWLGGFGIPWSERHDVERHLDALLPPVERAAEARGARMLYYSGDEVASDWLREPLTRRGFTLTATLRSYEKRDFAVPAEGSAEIHVRPFAPADLDGLLAVEQLAFAPPWRHDAASFLEVAESYPYVVVAEDASGIAGYQFNTLADGVGYLVRIAVHPRAVGRGVGTRLLAEAVHYFESARVRRIALNAEDQNSRAHALYERFGFVRVPPQGFVLERAIAAS